LSRPASSRGTRSRRRGASLSSTSASPPISGHGSGATAATNARVAFTPRVYFIPDLAFFFRQKKTDGIYGVVSPYVVTPSAGSDKLFIGSQLSLPMQMNLTPHLTYTVAYGHLFAGGFLKDLEPEGRSVTFLTNFLTYKF
jgi:hypothetical protein